MERLYLWKLVVIAQCLAIFKKKKTQRGISFRSRKLNKMCIMLKGVPSSVLASTVWKRVEIHSHKLEMDAILRAQRETHFFQTHIFCLDGPWRDRVKVMSKA